MPPIIPETTFREIAQQLLARSRNEVAWEEDDRYNNSFVVRLPQSFVRVSYVKSDGDKGNYRLTLEDSKQNEISEWAPLGMGADNGLLTKLFREASRPITHWDKVLEDVNRSLKTQGKIGQNVEVKIAS